VTAATESPAERRLEDAIADATARSVTLDTFTPSGDTPWGSITGLAPASINYEKADTSSPVTWPTLAFSPSGSL
jgi:hypothetical protein